MWLLQRRFAATIASNVSENVFIIMQHVDYWSSCLLNLVLQTPLYKVCLNFVMKNAVKCSDFLKN
jgi:hypothetical protein